MQSYIAIFGRCKCSLVPKLKLGRMQQRNTCKVSIVWCLVLSCKTNPSQLSLKNYWVHGSEYFACARKLQNNRNVDVEAATMIVFPQ